jgi:hypothetical protein
VNASDDQPLRRPTTRTDAPTQITQRRTPNNERITVHLPAELPSLTTSVSRVLLAILIELTEVEIAVDDRQHRGCNDR